MKRRRSTFIRYAWDEREALSPVEFSIALGAILLTLITMIVILLSGPAVAPSTAPHVLGPERGDRAYCWYVSNPCNDQLPTK